MASEIIVPTLGESVTEAIVARWLKAAGDIVAIDEPLVELETDKVTLEINAATGGTLREILVEEGRSVAVGAVLGILGDGVAPPQSGQSADQSSESDAETTENVTTYAEAGVTEAVVPDHKLSPAVRRLVEEHDLDAAEISGTGKDGRLTKGDVLRYLAERSPAVDPAPTELRSDLEDHAAAPRESRPAAPEINQSATPREERVRMTQLRHRIAQRLKEAQNTAAILTTFNEINMTNVLDARQRYRDMFEKRHGCRLGLMSFFVKACVVALKEIPAVNAEIDGDEIVYKNYYDIGVAVGTERGLVVPVLRNADTRSFAEIEQGIAELGSRAREGRLAMADLVGGTFSITNGGVYGSMMSTPILNPPQSGILGMHRIDRRPVAIDDEVRICPMMYVALSYDHRIIDGREAVTFLVRVKECIEDPERILLAI